MMRTGKIASMFLWEHAGHVNRLEYARLAFAPHKTRLVRRLLDQRLSFVL